MSFTESSIPLVGVDQVVAIEKESNRPSQDALISRAVNQNRRVLEPYCAETMASQDQLEVRVSVIIVPSILGIFPPLFIPIDFGTIHDIEDNPVGKFLVLVHFYRRPFLTHVNHANTRRPRTTVWPR